MRAVRSRAGAGLNIKAAIPVLQHMVVYHDVSSVKMAAACPLINSAGQRYISMITYASDIPSVLFI